MNATSELSLDVERSLLAGVLIDPSTLDRVCEFTTGSQFQSNALGRAFNLVADRYAARLPVSDLTILLPELRKAGIIDELGGAAGMAKLVNYVPSAGNVHYHATEVNRLWRLRQLRALVDDIASATDDPSADPAELVSKIEAQSVNMMAQGRDETISLSQMMTNLADQLDADREAGITPGVSTGFEAIDLTAGGMFPGEMIVLAARTSIGKTAMGLQLALTAARDGRSVLVLSLEMPELQLAQRIAAGQAGLSLTNQRNANHTSHDTDRIRQFAADHRDVNLMIRPVRRATVAQIAGYARATKATVGLDLLVIDYLQLIAPRDRRTHRYEQVTEISGEIKTLATELGIPVLSLAQLNRQGEGDAPALSHLRESGAIEQDADSVWFLHRDRDSTQTEFIIAKNRQGPRGKIAMVFDTGKCEFREPRIAEHPNYHREFAPHA